MRRKTRLTILIILLVLFTIFYISDYVLNHPASPYAQQELGFIDEDSLKQHYKKHGIEMGFASADEYVRRANEVIKGNVLSTRQDDNDIAYFNEESEEFVVVSPQGFIRTYFIPDTGIEYFKKQ